MNGIILILLLIIIICAVWEIDNNETFASESDQNSEALQNIASVYNESDMNLTNISATGTITGKIITPTHRIHSDDRIHISGGERLYLLNKDGVIIGKEWGGNGDLSVQGTITATGGELSAPSNLTISSSNSILKSPTTVEKDLKVNGKTKFNLNKARYIRVGNNDSPFWRHYWSLIELEAYDDSGNNVAKGKPVTRVHGTQHGNYAMSNITNGKVFDGGAGGRHFHDNIGLGYHGSTNKQELEIDLGSEKYITQIVLYGRYHGSYIHRLDGTSVKLLDANKNVTRKIMTGMWHDGTYSKEYLLN